MGYDSKFEASVAFALGLEQVEYKYEPFKIPYVSEYTPDFELTSNKILIEVKGYLRPEDRSKMIKVKKQHPELDIRFVFQNPNDKIKESKKGMTFAIWADKHGFKWAQSIVPREWIDE